MMSAQIVAWMHPSTLPSVSRDLLAELAEWIAIPSVSADPDACRGRRRSRRLAGGEDPRSGRRRASDRLAGSAARGRRDRRLAAEDGGADRALLRPLRRSGGRAARALGVRPVHRSSERDGWLYGRGTADDKGQLLMLLEAVRSLAREGDLPVNVRFACDGEEEVGGHSIVDYSLADERGADACLIFDTIDDRARTFPPSRSPRAVSPTSISSWSSGERDLHSGVYGGAALNALHALNRDTGGGAPGRRDACPSRCWPESSRRAPRSWRRSRRFRRAQTCLAEQGARPADRERRRGVLPSHLRAAGARRERYRGRLAAAAEDGAAGSRRGQPLDQARSRPGRRGDRRGAGAAPARGGSGRRRAPASSSSPRAPRGWSLRMRRRSSSPWRPSSAPSAAARCSFARAARCRSCTRSRAAASRRS